MNTLHWSGPTERVEPDPDSRWGVLPTTFSRRGRPAKVCELRKRELRLTPVDDQPIDWIDNPGIVKIAAFEEGGHGTTKKLHYHAIIETTLTEDALKSYCYKLTRGKGTEGNKAFMSRETHENTDGYISKHKTNVYLKGYTERDLQEWYAKSDEYVLTLKRDTDKYRKIKAQGRRRELLSVEQDIKTDLASFPDGERPYELSSYIVATFLRLCKERSFDFPTRTQMEGIVNRLRYDYDPSAVHAFYRRGLVSHSEDITPQNARW